MNKRFSIYLLVGMLCASVLFSCNKDNEDVILADSLISSTAVTEFSLKENADVLENLDTVFFTIDLEKAEIYNADSLPMGTDVSNLCIKMTYVACSSAEFHVKGGKWMKDTTFVYKSGDSIDFTGDGKFTLISQDLSATRTYDINVNVHKVKPDALSWGLMARRNLPAFKQDELVSQKTVQYDGKLYCLVNQGDSYVLSTTSHPGEDAWETTKVDFTFVPKNETFTATDNALYIMDENNALYTSVDGFTWAECGLTLYSILGTYDDRVLGVVKVGDTYKHMEYPTRSTFVSTEVAPSFPVEGVSQMVTLDSKWAVDKQRIVVGGVTASGTYLCDSWGYDGNNWGKISHKSNLPEMKGVTLFTYNYTHFDPESWITYEYPALFAVGGTMSDGDLDRDMVYISTDNGISWGVGNESLFLPEYIEPFTGAQAFVYNTTFTDNGARSGENYGWIEMPSSKMPVGYRYQSRATVAVTSWECPYIYLFGGTNGNGVLYNNIWRGVINRLTFKPLY